MERAKSPGSAGNGPETRREPGHRAAKDQRLAGQRDLISHRAADQAEAAGRLGEADLDNSYLDDYLALPDGDPDEADLDPDALLEGFDLEEFLGIEPEDDNAQGRGINVIKTGVDRSESGGHKGTRPLIRKLSSEKALEDAIDWHWREGDQYHCFSFGDVDALSFLKMVLRQQPVSYAAISTWCMASEDMADLAYWHEIGVLGRVDFFMGEIFRASYSAVYRQALDFIGDCGGRMVIFRNHAKIIAIEGERFDRLIESSANVNTNPRSENTAITVDRELPAAYIRLLAEIHPFNTKDYGAEPYFGRGGQANPRA